MGLGGTGGRVSPSFKPFLRHMSEIMSEKRTSPPLRHKSNGFLTGYPVYFRLSHNMGHFGVG